MEKTFQAFRGKNQVSALLEFLACIPLARCLSSQFRPPPREPQRMLHQSVTAASRRGLPSRPPTLETESKYLLNGRQNVALKRRQDGFTRTLVI